jgi:hypothetical protein
MERNRKETQQAPVRPMLDDQTLLVLVTFLYAFFQIFSLLNVPTCAC